MEPALSIRSVSKRFPGVLANDQVSIDVAERSVSGIIGENGAGKSTLMAMVAGLYQPDTGTIAVAGEVVDIRSPIVAARLGIGMVHQEFKLVPSMSVTENVILGTRHGRGRLRLNEAAANVSELGERYGLRIDPQARIRDLPVGLRQRVEILKALHGGARLLIFDEPTAVLTPQEADELFATFRSLVEQGRTVVFISHKLREVIGVTDQVSVMRKGRVVAQLATAATSEAELAELMVGRKVALHRSDTRRGAALGATTILNTPARNGSEEQSGPRADTPPRLTVVGASARGDLGQEALRDVSFEVRPGEIVGIAGVAGNGQLELEQVLFGLRELSAGRVLVDGDDISSAAPNARRKLGIAYIPEDRGAEGTDATSSVARNLIMGAHATRPIARGGLLSRQGTATYVRDLLQGFSVSAAGPETNVSTLSGGNVQRIILARELAGVPHVLTGTDPTIVIASQPTRGVDVGAIEYIHNRLLELRDSGSAILVISFELDEIFFLSDRIRVMHDGRMSDELRPEETSEREVGLLMGGVTSQAAEPAGDRG